MTKEEIMAQWEGIDINESGGADTFREGEDIVERDPIAVIIKHPTDELYLIAAWANGWRGFLTGGIEEGDTIESTVEKEIREETGFLHVPHIERTDAVSHGLFYHTVKRVNRLAHYHLVIARLGGLEQEEVSAEEKAIATFIWVAKEDVLETLRREDMKQLWRYYLGRG